MPVPFFTIDAELRQLYFDCIDTMRLDPALSKDCRLVMPGTAPCPNCVLDPAMGRSAGAYNGTGPRPFSRPPCPVCGGSGQSPTPIVEVVRLGFRRGVRNSFALPPGVVVEPVDVAKIKGFASDLPRILAADFIVLDFAHSDDRYRKLSEPNIRGGMADGRYFDMLLKRVVG